ncbi:fimbrillin family protein [Phocaeicola sp.]
MRTKTFMTMATVALMAASCSNDGNEVTNEWDGRIHLNSGVTTQSRATHNLDEKIGNEETVYLYIDKGSSEASLLYGKQLTANGSNGFSGADNMYFPAGEASIKHYAFHVNESGMPSMTTNNYPAGQLTHKVEADQTTADSNTGYAKSDLLYASGETTRDYAKTNKGEITLKFTHLLSKIEVVLVKGTSEPKIESMAICGTKPNGTFTPNKTSSFTVTVADGEAQPIQIDCGLTEKATVEKDNDDTDKVLNEAIIIPQTLQKGSSFIEITLTDGGKLYYKLEQFKDKSGNDVVFEAGKKYRYTITANLTGMSVKSEVSGWDPQTGGTGEATM